MKKFLIVFMLLFATVLCSCKSKDVEVLSVAGETGVTTYTIHGQACLDGLDYETAHLNVAVPKLEDRTLTTCIATYNPKINKEIPETTTYVLAEDCLFYSSESDILHKYDGNIENDIVYEELNEKKFLKKYNKMENPKMYLWLNDNGEVSIAMLYSVNATKK